jgi:hypothetical protein
MIIYLAGEVYGKETFKSVDYKFNRLDSFYYIKNNKDFISYIPYYKNYLLDSGAFTFIMGKKVSIDIDSYTDQYIEFINQHKVDKYFEMDVDKIYGYDKVKRLRNKIESRTGVQSIPVFHMNRGLDDWKAMTKDYKYVSIGIAGKDVGWGDYNAFYSFVMSAKENGCKVHGLGITGMKSLERVPFYSVDSSGWTTGNRYKSIFKFDGTRVKNLQVNLNGKKIHNHLALAKHNLREWIMFAESMENKLVI